jgi:hypothetical protein
MLRIIVAASLAVPCLIAPSLAFANRVLYARPQLTLGFYVLAILLSYGLAGLLGSYELLCCR